MPLVFIACGMRCGGLNTHLSSFSCQVEREIIEVLMNALRHTEPELAHVGPTSYSQRCVCVIASNESCYQALSSPCS